MNRADVIGAGPAGLVSAMLLKKHHGFRTVRVHERRLPDENPGLGIILHQDSLEKLHGIDPSMAAQVRQSGRLISDVVVSKEREVSHFRSRPLLGIPRWELLCILREYCVRHAVEIHYGSCIRHHSDLPPSDLLVVADGAFSTFRSHYDALFQPYRLPHKLRYHWFSINKGLDDFIFDFASTEYGNMILHAYPFSRSQSSAIVETRQQNLQSLNPRNGESLSRFFSQVFSQSLCGESMVPPGDTALDRWMAFHSVGCRRWFAELDGRWLVLVGDAARTVHFSIGSGTRLAIADAVALSDALMTQSEPISAFTHYQSLRQKTSERYQKLGIQSSEWFSRAWQYFHLPQPEFGHALMGRATVWPASGQCQ
ncbi:MAG: FAD-dependent monooxygenase [Oleiphilaceae bacterium]|nr:FAD-dependent monooxygenase [Oleiphilaceae bacterium]